MADLSTKEGRIPFQIPSIDAPCFTYYKVIGDLSRGAPPLVVLHGGPGSGHEYLLPFADLWLLYRLPVVFYDQIGCASSTHLPEKANDKSFWQESLFIAELDNLIDHLHLRDGPGFHLYGQSWGGMLGAAFAASGPRGLRRLVLASPLASNELSTRGLHLLRNQLPLDQQQALEEGEQEGDFASPAYIDAIGAFYKKHLCRTEPFPPTEMLPALGHLSQDTSIHKIMWGPSPLQPTGSLQGWTCIPRLPQITAPTLVYNGEFDTSHDIATIPFFEKIPRVRWITFSEAGHMCHLEGKGRREETLRVVGEFLTQGSEVR